MRILYVEDNATDADLFRRSLARGWPEAAVSICASIAAARLRLERAPVFDVVVTDLSLPDGCGLDLLEPARASRLPLAFVVLTGAGDHNAAIAALKSGVDDYLVKEGDYLGRLPATLGAAIARARADRVRRNRPIRVLYAEPDRADAELAVRRLAQAAPQLRVDHVGHADEVVSRILDGDGACPHDLLLLDFQLSGASSLDVAKALRQDHGLDLPIVLLIAQGGEETAVQALRLGVSDYVVKHPGYLRELPLVLENAFRHAELVRERAALKATSERLAKVLSMSPSVNYALRFPGTGAELSWISENVSRVLGYAPDEALQPGWLAGCVCGPDRQLFDAGLDELVRSDHRVQEYRFRHADGQTIWVRDEARLVRGERGEPVQAAGMLSDITEQRSATEMLRLNAAVIESTHDAVVITDLQGTIVSVNRAFTEVTGYSRDEVVGRNPRFLQSGRHDRAFYREMWGALCETGYWQGELWNRRKDGELYPEWLTLNAVRTAAGETTHYVAVFTDISKLKKTEARLDHLAHHDALTDLPNRLLVLSRLEHAIEHSHRSPSRIAVLFIDLDRFKTVNDSLGHAVGDELLCEVARRLRARLREEDTLGRLGGDEFIVLLERIDEPGDAAVVAGHLVEALAQPFSLPSGHEVYIHASIGISVYPDDGLGITELVRNADAAMYRAKSMGRNTYGFYTDDLTRYASQRLDLETRLRRALAQQEFRVHFQPVIAVADGRLLGAEALVRWQPPGEALILPAQFIPIAEEAGLIGAIGEWVLRTACGQVRSWLDAGHAFGSLAVNLSAEQFRHRDIEQTLRAAIADTGLPADRLELEITESQLMEQGERIGTRVDALKRLGVRLAIDDFGTGYSSLAYLKRFAIDKLKIDRSFVKDIAEDRNDLAIAAAIVAMARALGIAVQAEGVENSAQLGLLRQLECGAYQGFLCSPALAADEFESRFLVRS